ncbi:DEAD/DEAH box helicase [Aquabacterium sp. OR-4]|uniref:DEAD/DEAH box helicase n=1 Tax=Aquabacterium sp. OR-4 TaxID=2978127 RepID=UPI0021B3CAE5|nr:DEAD/DEAH box helicase [Aquabacterium sp. OR-4]MDT7836617.1 DEAD/DEAH box helicase [Aquabacterium sp. OR-4]
MTFDTELNTALPLDADLDTADTASATTEPQGVPGAEFAALGLAPEVVSAITRAGYNEPTPVQARAVPVALTGVDLLVSSQTGSGKTASFVWPALQTILNARRDPAKKRAKGQPCGPRILVLVPTRELALQVARACTTYGLGMQGLRVAHVVGGVPYQAQLKALRAPLDVLIATPGRLLDLMGSGAAILNQVDMLVLDEADRMLDMGFIDDITAVAEALPATRQTLMFSATFAGSVGRLAQSLTRDPQRISIDSHTDTHARIEQRIHWADSLSHKRALLEQLLADPELDQAVVFTSTQQDADVLADALADIGHAVASLHGGMPQGRRNRVLQGLRQRQLRVLVATDVAARGIDVPTITHVINWGLPMKAEDYVHRIGRTGRAGRSGLAITLAERRDVPMIRRIERFTTQPIAVSVVPGLEPKAPPPSDSPRDRRPGGGFGGFGGGRGERPAFGRGRPGPGGQGGGNGGGNGGGFGSFNSFGRDRGHGGPAPQGDRGGFGGQDRGGFGGQQQERGGFGGPQHDRGGFGGPRGGHGDGQGAGDGGFRGGRPDTRGGQGGYQADGRAPFRGHGPAGGPRRGGSR